MQKAGPPYDCRVHSVRARLGDPDGISAKFAIDAISRMEGTILIDDSALYVESIKFTQEKCRPGEEEKTLIYFE